MYYVITTSADGVHVTVYTKEGLEQALSETGGFGSYKILPSLPKENNPNYWGESMVIIKGEVVTPKPIQVVQRFELP